MKNAVVDAWALVAWLKDERPASEHVTRLLDRAAAGNVQAYISAINAGEVYYSLIKDHKPDLANRFRNLLPSMPLTTVLPDIEAVWRAAEWKASHRLSYADAFAAALVVQLGRGAVLYTGDPELKAALPAGQVYWLRRDKK